MSASSTKVYALLRSWCWQIVRDTVHGSSVSWWLLQVAIANGFIVTNFCYRRIELSAPSIAYDKPCRKHHRSIRYTCYGNNLDSVLAPQLHPESACFCYRVSTIWRCWHYILWLKMWLELSTTAMYWESEDYFSVEGTVYTTYPENSLSPKNIHAYNNRCCGTFNKIYRSNKNAWMS